MHMFAAAGTGFLLAVLWFDLMFDVQTRKHTGDLPPEVLASISAYYRRVTTEAYPMNRLVALVMVLTLAAICAEIVQGGKSVVDRMGFDCARRRRFCADHDAHRPERPPAGERKGFGGGAIETGARGLSGSSIQLCAHERGFGPAIERGLRKARWKVAPTGSARPPMPAAAPARSCGTRPR
jgi:hypothetical protein